MSFWFWFNICGSALAIVLTIIGLYMTLREKANFGTESRNDRDLSKFTPTGSLPPSGVMREATFGTETHEVRDVSDLTPTKNAG